ncbi:hypothetical protein JOQ06_006161, partial [Pogonophryne albipinna]
PCAATLSQANSSLCPYLPHLKAYSRKTGVCYNRGHDGPTSLDPTTRSGPQECRAMQQPDRSVGLIRYGA